MKYSCYQDYFVILGWLVYWVFGCEMRRFDKKSSEIIVFKNKLLLVLRLAGWSWMRKRVGKS